MSGSALDRQPGWLRRALRWMRDSRDIRPLDDLPIDKFNQAIMHTERLPG